MVIFSQRLGLFASIVFLVSLPTATQVMMISKVFGYLTASPAAGQYSQAAMSRGANQQWMPLFSRPATTASAMDLSLCECEMKTSCAFVGSFYWLSNFQILMLPSAEPLARLFPSEEKARLKTSSVCPARVCSRVPLAVRMEML